MRRLPPCLGIRRQFRSRYPCPTPPTLGRMNLIRGDRGEIHLLDGHLFDWRERSLKHSRLRPHRFLPSLSAGLRGRALSDGTGRRPDGPSAYANCVPVCLFGQAYEIFSRFRFRVLEFAAPHERPAHPRAGDECRPAKRQAMPNVKKSN